jgi:hypothetical protein
MNTDTAAATCCSVYCIVSLVRSRITVVKLIPRPIACATVAVKTQGNAMYCRRYSHKSNEPKTPLVAPGCDKLAPSSDARVAYAARVADAAGNRHTLFLPFA